MRHLFPLGLFFDEAIRKVIADKPDDIRLRSCLPVLLEFIYSNKDRPFS